MKTKRENPLPKILPGSISMQMIRCGKPACKCSGGNLHGPYFYRFYRDGGRLRKHYVKKNDLADTLKACERHRNDQWRRRLEAKYDEAKLRELKAQVKGLLEQMNEMQ